MRFEVRPSGPLRGRIAVPGDKSIAHRWLMLAAAAEGDSVLRGLPASHDVRSTAACLVRLGEQPGLEAWLRGRARGRARVWGRGYAGFRRPELPLDCGNSGTTMRLLAGLLAGRPFSCVLDGDESLRRRPMERVAEPLRAMGADVETEDGHAPLRISGGRLRGVEHRLEVASAQVKGGILLAAVQAGGLTAVTVPGLTRDHTERALEALGAAVQREGLRVRVRGPFRHRGFRAAVPGDASSAAFQLVAAAILPGSEVTVERVGTNPSRLVFLDVLRRAGAEVHVAAGRRSLGEPSGSITVRARELRSFEVSGDELPAVVDEVPALAALAVHAPGASRFLGAGELRVKESDRLEGMAAGLGSLGARARAEGDVLVVEGGGLAGGDADARGDHRLAMALAVAALAGEGPSRVEGAEWTAVSFPGFAAGLRAVGGAVEEAEG